MKLSQKTLTDLVTASGGSVPAVPGLGTPGKPDDIVSRINDTITNFKSLLTMAQAAQTRAAERQAAPSGGGLDLGQLADTLIKQGFGNAPIGKLLENIAPMTLNQLKGVLSNERQSDG